MMMMIGNKMVESNVVYVSDEKYEKKYGKKISYYLDPRLKRNLDTKVTPSLKINDKDVLLLVDGAEGAGKSWLGMQIGKYIDNSLDLSRVVFTAEDFRNAILKAKKGQVVIYDEAFTGLSSRSSLSGVNRVLVSLMMQMRQKNLCVIVILPTIFLLDKYASVFRSKALIHVYETGGNRGYFRVYNQKLKKLLYLFGSKSYNYAPRLGTNKKKRLHTNFKGRFYGVFALGDEEVEKKYREMKMKALELTEKDPMSSQSVKYREQRDIIIYLLRKELKLSYRKLANYLSDYNFDISHMQIRSICSKFGDKEAKEDLEEEKIKEKSDKEEESIEYSDEDAIKDGLMDEEEAFEDKTEEKE